MLQKYFKLILESKLIFRLMVWFLSCLTIDIHHNCATFNFSKNVEHCCHFVEILVNPEFVSVSFLTEVGVDLTELILNLTSVDHCVHRMFYNQQVMRKLNQLTLSQSSQVQENVFCIYAEIMKNVPIEQFDIFFQDNKYTNFDHLIRNEKNKNILELLYRFLANMALNEDNSVLMLVGSKMLENMSMKIHNLSHRILTFYYLLLNNIVFALVNNHSQTL